MKFPSGRNIKRAKQDAKALAKKQKISLHLALNETARINGGVGNWNESLSVLKANQPRSQKPESSYTKTRLAIELGISDSDLDQLSYEVDTNESSDGLVYDYLLTFDDSCPIDILENINSITDDKTVRVSVNAFDDPEEFEDEPVTYFEEFDMNPYRKLLVLGLNEVLDRGLLSLHWDRESKEKTSHIETTLAGHNSIVQWSDAGFGEILIGVWWKYDHNEHPQANKIGSAKETFSTASPLAKRQHYRKFVGVVCSAWLERDKGKYLQGVEDDHVTNKYARKGELQELKKIPNPLPHGFKPEGPFHT